MLRLLDLLEYSDVVWDDYSQHEPDELEKDQNEVARIVMDATTFICKLVSINALISETR